MGIQYRQTDANAICSTGAPLNRDAVEGGTAGTSPVNATYGATGAGNEVFAILPDLAAWAAGDYVVRFNVTTANMNVTLDGVRITRRNQSACGTIIETLGEVTNANISLGTIGVKEVTVSCSGVASPAAGDFIQIRQLASASMTGSTVGWTPDQLIDTPLVSGGGTQFQQSLSGTASFSGATNRTTRTAKAAVLAFAASLAGVLRGFASYLRSLNPTGYWRLGDEAGPLADEIAGRDLAVTGSPTFGVPGALQNDPDTAIEWSGSGQYAVGPTDFPTPTDSISVAFLFKTTNANASARGLMSRRAADQASWGAVLDANQRILALMYRSDANAHVIAAQPSGALNDGNWHLVVVTFDETTLRIYVDGSEVASSTALAGTWHKASTGKPTLAASTDTGGGFLFPGTLDEPAIFTDRVLTAGEVAEMWALADVVAGFQQAVSGALSFAGATSRSTKRALAASLGPTGALGRVVHRTLEGAAAALSFGGSLAAQLIEQLAQAFEAALSFTGSLPRRTGHVLSGALAFSGALGRIASFLVDELAAALSFSGDLAASLAEQLAQAFNASLDFSASLARRTATSLAAALDFAATLTRRATRSLAAVLTFNGTLTGSLVEQLAQAFNATLDFSATVVRRSARSLAGSLSFVATLSRRATRSLAAALAFSGTLIRRAQHALTATLSFAGSLSRSSRHALTAALDFTASLGQRAAKVLSASLDFATAQTRRTARAIAAALSFASDLGIGGLLAKTFDATLHFTAGLGRRITQTIAGDAAQLAFSASVTARAIYARILAASLGFSGSVNRQTRRALAATLSFAAEAARSFQSGAQEFFQTLAGALDFNGTLQRRTSRALAATLGFAGDVAATLIELLRQSFAATLSFGATISRQTAHGMAASVDFAGSLARRTALAFAAVLDFVGTSPVAKRIKAATAAIVARGASAAVRARSLSVGMGTRLISARIRPKGWALT